jgi:rhomboid protease GluP
MAAFRCKLVLFLAFSHPLRPAGHHRRWHFTDGRLQSGVRRASAARAGNLSALRAPRKVRPRGAVESGAAGGEDTAVDASPLSDETVFRAHSRHACAEVALVLEAVGLRPVVHELDGAWVIVVAAHDAPQARGEIAAWLAENRPRPEQPDRPASGQARAGVAAYVAIVVLVALAVGNYAFDRDWLAAGRIHGAAMLGGEWWRALTALTLHADLEHLAANVLRRRVRLVRRALPRLGCRLAADPARRRLRQRGQRAGAGARGTGRSAPRPPCSRRSACSARWAGRAPRQPAGRIYRWGPVIAAVALLAYTGAGGERTDIGAHIWGFAAGLGAGALAERIPAAAARRGAVQSQPASRRWACLSSPGRSRSSGC